MDAKLVWRVVKWMCVLQLFNAEMDYLISFYFGVLVPAWVLASLNLAYAVVILGIMEAKK